MSKGNGSKFSYKSKLDENNKNDNKESDNFNNNKFLSSIRDRAISLEYGYLTNRFNFQSEGDRNFFGFGFLLTGIIILLFEIFGIIYFASLGGYKYGVIGYLTLSMEGSNLILSFFVEFLFISLIALIVYINFVFFVYYTYKER